MRKGFLYFFIFFLGALRGASPELVLSANSAVIMDMSTGCVIFEKNADKVFFPASITKILTGALAIKYGKLDDKITVSRKAAYGIEPGSSSIALKPNEVVCLRDVLYGLMLRSANECGNVIAEHVSGSNEAFAVLMNETAKSLGCKKSQFMNPHGLHHSDHRVSAYDMALIARYAMSFPLFRKIVKTPFYPFPDTNIHKQSERGMLRNKNQMLHPRKKEFYSGCTGIKGGFTSKALHTFVASAKKNDREVLVVVLNVSSKADMYDDVRKCLDFGLGQYEKKMLVGKGEKIEDLRLKWGDGPVSAVARDTVEMVLPVKIGDSGVMKKVSFLPLSLPIVKGQKLGDIEFFVKNKFVGKSDIVADNDVFEIYSWDFLKNYVITFPFLAGSAVFLSGFIFWFFRALEKRHH